LTCGSLWFIIWTMKATKSFTLHNLDYDLYTFLLAEAGARDTSLNNVTKSLLREAAGLTSGKKKRDLSDLAGSWTKEEAEEFDRNIADTEVIHPDDWK